VGFALWFPTFSTFRGAPGLWLEDLYVRPEHRAQGHGRALLAALRDCTDQRIEWSVLDWNELARGFYRNLGAYPLDEWTTWRWLPEGETEER
jgi:GNAT superfamily N-acetyltransferase